MYKPVTCDAGGGNKNFVGKYCFSSADANGRAV
jgi:hypothetical protein